AQRRINAIKGRRQRGTTVGTDTQIPGFHEESEEAKAKFAKSKKGRSQFMERVVEGQQLAKRATALLKRVNKELRETKPRKTTFQERDLETQEVVGTLEADPTATFRAGLEEAKRQLTEAREHLKSNNRPGARRAVARAEDIVASFEEEYEGVRDYGTRPEPPKRPTAEVIPMRRRRRGRVRHRTEVAAPDTEPATAEELSLRDRVKAVSHRRSLNRGALDALSKAMRARARRRSEGPPTSIEESKAGQPSKPLAARAPAMWRDWDRASRALEAGNFEAVYAAMRRMLRDVREAQRNGDKSKLVERLETILQLGLQNNVTADIWRTLDGFRRALVTIDFTADRNIVMAKPDTRNILQTLTHEVTIEKEDLMDPAVQEFLKSLGALPQPKQEANAAVERALIEAERQRFVGRGVAPGRRITDTRPALPVDTTPTQTEMDLVVKPKPFMRRQVSALRTPFTAEERAILKQVFKYTDEQISLQSMAGTRPGTR
ncbi:MAG TPA: hypothetical protein VN764_09195, partial [Polyangiaceae bacterium]|nr:hypothetical protein [Polyangiaceae bacterium]